MLQQWLRSHDCDALSDDPQRCHRWTPMHPLAYYCLSIYIEKKIINYRNISVFIPSYPYRSSNSIGCWLEMLFVWKSSASAFGLLDSKSLSFCKFSYLFKLSTLRYKFEIFTCFWRISFACRICNAVKLEVATILYFWSSVGNKSGGKSDGGPAATSTVPMGWQMTNS